jgi:ParB family chromosome partitioning protein
VARLLNPQAGEDKQEKPVRVLDPNVRQAERSLEQALGVKVEIRDRKGKGKIILKYGSLEDFDRIMEALAAK